MPDREISLPFRLDNQGRVAATSDPEAIGRSHLTTFLLTDPGERVMRPEWGTPIRSTVFEPLDELTASLLLERIRDRVKKNVPGVVIQRISSPIDSDSATLQVTVEFALAVGAGEGAVRSTTITMGASG